MESTQHPQLQQDILDSSCNLRRGFNKFTFTVDRDGKITAVSQSEQFNKPIKTEEP